MQVDDEVQRLSLTSTLWSMVRRAHEGPTDAVRDARRQLVERYGGAVRRYLGKAVRDADAADELFQEFALSLVAGELRGADPARGRFRDFVKGVLFHLIADYHNRRRRQPQTLPFDGSALAPADSETPDPDASFLESWRDELLACAWTSLNEIEQQTSQPFYTVLRFRAEHPELHSPQMAEQLGRQLGRPLNAAWVRQALHRARLKFTDLFLDAVAQSLESPSRERLEQELLDLGMLDYCKPALARQGSKLTPPGSAPPAASGGAPHAQ